MDKIIGVTDLQRNFRAVLDEVVDDRTPYILTRGSRPEAVLISYEQYQRLVDGQESTVLARIEELLKRLAQENSGYTDAEVEADVSASRHEARQRK